MRDNHMTSDVTPAIDSKTWITALETVFVDLIDHTETRKRRIILEGLSGIYSRLEDLAEPEHTVRETAETAPQTCNVVNLEAYRPALVRQSMTWSRGKGD